MLHRTTLVIIGTIVILTIIIVIFSPDVFSIVIGLLRGNVDSGYYRFSISSHLESSDIDFNTNTIGQIAYQEEKEITEEVSISLGFA